MFSLKKLLFREAAPDHLPEDVRAALEQWSELASPELASLHFHTRYVVVDLATTGSDPDSDQVLSIAAVSVCRNTMRSDDALFLDIPETADAQTLARQLAVFLKFVGKSPLVTYHVPYVAAFLQRLLKDHLGVVFQTQWLDLAWLLPSMFEERHHSVMPLDFWIDSFGLEEGDGRRDTMANTLLLARLFQMLIVRAVAMDVVTMGRLLDESRASSFLRRTH